MNVDITSGSVTDTVLVDLPIGELFAAIRPPQISKRPEPTSTRQNPLTRPALAYKSTASYLSLSANIAGVFNSFAKEVLCLWCFRFE